MKTVRIRASSLYAPPAYRHARLVDRRGRLAIAQDYWLRHFLVHVPTGLRCHPDLENFTRQQATAALALLASVGDWDWTDPLAVVEMPLEQNRSLLDFCAAVGEMVRS